MQDYFADDSVYSARTFRRRFRMRWPLYLRIVAAIEEHASYFQQRADATGKLGLYSAAKVHCGNPAACLRYAGGCGGRVRPHRIKHSYQELAAVLFCGTRGVRRGVSTCAKCRRRQSAASHAWGAWLRGHAWQLKLHALAVEKLSDGVGRAVHRQGEYADHCARGGGL
ncbi:hypothetical protein PHYSODRAFT_253080, partial [Phytophthora sojae]